MLAGCCSSVAEHLCTVDPQLSEHLRTEGGSDI